MGSEAWNGDPGPSASFLSRAAYLASVEFVDEGIGDILSKVEETDEEFMIIWVADHGDMNGDHNLWRKGYPFEGELYILPSLVKTLRLYLSVRYVNSNVLSIPLPPPFSV